MHGSAPVWLSALGALAAFLVALISFVLHNVTLGEVIDPAMFAAKVGILVAMLEGTCTGREHESGSVLFGSKRFA